VVRYLVTPWGGTKAYLERNACGYVSSENLIGDCSTFLFINSGVEKQRGVTKVISWSVDGVSVDRGEVDGR
jgi:hypothetical protein